MLYFLSKIDPLSNEHNMIVINQPMLGTYYIYLATSVMCTLIISFVVMLTFSERRSNLQDKSRLSMR